MSQREEEQLAWSAGWKRAQSIAEKTLSGLRLDANLTHPNALFRAFQTHAKIWERLCSRELRTEDEVRAAAKTIGLILERDNQQIIAMGKIPIEFNKFQPVGQKTRIVTELEWMADVYECALGDTAFDSAPFEEFDLDGWKPWEIIYVTGLRMIDDAVQALNAGHAELGTSLVFDALNEMYMCDIFANGNERNKGYSTRLDRIYGQKRRDVDITEKVNEKVGQAVKEAVKKDRIELAKAAAIKRNEKNSEMRKFVIDRWNAEKESYEKNKSDFARHYSRLLLQENEFEVKASTIATRWLRGL